MGQNILVLDLETKRTFDDTGSRSPESLGVTVVGVFDYLDMQYKVFREEDLGRLEERLTSKPLLVGFNIERFDLPVLRPYFKIRLSDIPVLDILSEVTKALGHRVSLNSVAKATLGETKSGNGLDAIKYYEAGEWDKLEKYCLDDVRITKEIFEYGARHKEIFYLTKFDQAKARLPVQWEIEAPSLVNETQFKLF